MRAICPKLCPSTSLDKSPDAPIMYAFEGHGPFYVPPWTGLLILWLLSLLHHVCAAKKCLSLSRTQVCMCLIPRRKRLKHK